MGNNFALPIMKLLVHESNVHYPDRLQEVYVLGVNLVIRAIFNVIYPLLHPRTRRKINLVGPYENDEVMQSLLPPDILPSTYGGAAKPWVEPAQAKNLAES